MPQVHKTTQSGEHAQKFIEFVLMHSQNAAFFLGQMPNPQTGKAEVNLEMAKIFIDQLEMIQEKTRGNLSSEESEVLNNALTNLRMAFVNAKSGAGATSQPDAPAPESTPPSSDSSPDKSAEASVKENQPETGAESASSTSDTESKKKFTKSYGP